MDQPRTNVFLSYPRANQGDAIGCSPCEEAFVHRVAYFLRKQVDLEIYCYDIQGADDLWEIHVHPHLSAANILVLFLGESIHSGQHEEIEAWKTTRGGEKDIVLVNLRANYPIPVPQRMIKGQIAVDTSYTDPIAYLESTERFARLIYEHLPHGPEHSFWIDGLPIGYPFGYEKSIIKAFVAEGSDPFSCVDPGESHQQDLRSPALLAAGIPVKWPNLESDKRGVQYRSPLAEVEFGSYRDDNWVIVDPRHAKDSRMPNACLTDPWLELPEAGPRSTLALPIEGTQEIVIGIVVSGGIAPGINAVMEGIIERHRQYRGQAVQKAGASSISIENGDSKPTKNSRAFPPLPSHRLILKVFTNGLIGITEDRVHEHVIGDEPSRSSDARSSFVDNLTDAKALGGSVVTTARHDDLLDGGAYREDKIDDIVEKLTADTRCRVDILYVIGGEGSMRAAHALATRAKFKGKSITVVGIPKTMDNDILWVWQSFGFLSAVEKAREFFSQLETEVRSNPRLCVMQLFGSDSGFVVSHTALAGGSTCLAALIPEIDFSMKRLREHLKNAFRNRPYGILVLAETAMPIDAEDHLDDPEVALEEHEKSAVRAFVGSAMLHESEITEVNWKELLATLVETTVSLGSSPSPNQILFDHNDETRLRELQEVTLTQSLSRQQSFEGLSIINKVIMDKYEVCSRVPENRGMRGNYTPLFFFGEPIRKAIKVVAAAIGSQSPPSNQDVAYLDALAKVMCLPYEARAIIRLIKNANQFNDYLFTQLQKRLHETFNRLVCESNWGIPKRNWTRQSERRVFGQTPDALRTASLKIVSRVLQAGIQPESSTLLGGEEGFWERYKHRVFESEPRHLIRAIGPSCHDIIFCDRMGRLAVDGAMSGYTDFMVSQWLTEFVLVPLSLVVLGRKRVPSDGIFWKSVIASTGQPENLWY